MSLFRNLTYGEKSESVDGPVQPSPLSSPQRHDTSTTASSPSGGRTPTTPHSGIPLPRNPTKAMVGATHQSSSNSDENLESKALNLTQSNISLDSAEAVPTIPVENPNPSTILVEPIKAGLSYQPPIASRTYRSFNAGEINCNFSVGFLINKHLTVANSLQATDSEANEDDDACPNFTHSLELESSNSILEQPKSSPSEKTGVNPSEVFPSSPEPISLVSQNGTLTTPTVSSQSPLPITPSPTPTPPTQTRRTSGLMGPKVVVNKPGINVYRGRNAPLLNSSSSSPLGKTGPAEGDSQNDGSTAPADSTLLVTQNTVVSPPSSLSTTLAPPSPTTLPVPANPKPSNIRPPSVTVEGFTSTRNRSSRSSIPTRSSSGTRSGNHDSSPSAIPAVRSIPPPTTGIRMPSRLPRQTAAKADWSSRILAANECATVLVAYFCLFNIVWLLSELVLDPALDLIVVKDTQNSGCWAFGVPLAKIFKEADLLQLTGANTPCNLEKPFVAKVRTKDLKLRLLTALKADTDGSNALTQ
ncbi:hypothetical protein Aperf_G00000066805 [Anoplocephala perfoliata]